MPVHVGDLKAVPGSVEMLTLDRDVLKVRKDKAGECLKLPLLFAWDFFHIEQPL